MSGWVDTNLARQAHNDFSHPDWVALLHHVKDGSPLCKIYCFLYRSSLLRLMFCLCYLGCVYCEVKFHEQMHGCGCCDCLVLVETLLVLEGNKMNMVAAIALFKHGRCLKGMMGGWEWMEKFWRQLLCVFCNWWNWSLFLFCSYKYDCQAVLSVRRAAPS